MRDDIRTRWHDWLECHRQGQVLIDDSNGTLVIQRKMLGFDKTVLDEVVPAVADLPHYFLTQECIDLINSDKGNDSVRALHRLGMAELRDEIAVVEFSAPGGPGLEPLRHFVIVSKRDRDPAHLLRADSNEHVFHPYQTVVLTLYRPDYNRGSFQRIKNSLLEGRAMQLWDGPALPREWAIASSCRIYFAIVDEGFIDAHGHKMTKDELHFGIANSPWMTGERSQIEPTVPNKDAMEAGAIAVRALLMLLRTRGVERTSVSPSKVNAARARKGRTQVPDHTVVYLGHYYNKKGERVKYDPTKPGHKFQSFHTRGPHVQGYWVGSGENKRLVEKYVEMYLVNYAGEDEIPKPKRRVVRVRPNAKELT